MAEAQQPQRGSTSKFTDTLGKMDALIFAAFGINLQSFLNALGIASLKDLKSFNWKNVNIDLLLALLLSLSRLNLKNFLALFNLSSLNMRSFLSALGIPSSLLTLLDMLQGLFSRGGGLFTGGYEIPGISDSFTPNQGWLPGDPEDLLDITNPPQTGWMGELPDDPNNPLYIFPGSENSGNVLAGITNPNDILDRVLPDGGTNIFNFDPEYDSPVRFDVSKFVPWSEIGGMDYLRSWFIQELQKLEPQGQYKVITEEGRIDNISYNLYGDTQYWWILLQYNGIVDIDDLKTGFVLEFPPVDALEDLYFRCKSLADEGEK